MALASVRPSSASALMLFLNVAPDLQGTPFPWNELIGFPRVSTLIKQPGCSNQHLPDLLRVKSAAALECVEDDKEAGRDGGRGKSASLGLC